MKIPPVVASAEEWPEVPGARIVVQREGDFLPHGYWRVLSRVLRYGWPGGLPRPRGKDHVGPSGLEVTESNGDNRDILLVAPTPDQPWCGMCCWEPDCDVCADVRDGLMPDRNPHLERSPA